jgi:hypothetical protein
MDACPLLITSIVAVKPEDQGAFFQDFWAYPAIFARLVDSILTLLCCVAEMLRTTMKPNGERYLPPIMADRLYAIILLCRQIAAAHPRRRRSGARCVRRRLNN